MRSAHMARLREWQASEEAEGAEQLSCTLGGMNTSAAHSCISSCENGICSFWYLQPVLSPAISVARPALVPTRAALRYSQILVRLELQSLP